MKRLNNRRPGIRNIIDKFAIGQILDELPINAGLYWQLRRQIMSPKDERYWNKFQKHLPRWVAEVCQMRQQNLAKTVPSPKRLLLFACQRYWIQYTTLLGLALAGLEHEVSLAYVPYIKWQERINRFEDYRQQARLREVLEPAKTLLTPVSFSDAPPAAEFSKGANNKVLQKLYQQLPPKLAESVEQVSIRDVQYTLQVEEVDRQGDLFLLRMERNAQAAKAALDWIETSRPDAIITPNGSILEMGAIYQVARYLEIPVVTYEFGEQRGRIWIAQDAEVMHQDTDELWVRRQNHPLNEAQWEQIRALFASRQRASLWENFARLWQGQPTKGGERVRQELRLDDRPIFLLPANVIGDSLTLGRQVFSQSMTEWLERTILYLASRPQVQLIIRIHPGERYLQGPSVADVARRVLPDMSANSNTSHIRLLTADAPVNTYDLAEIADLGIVYTTTVGLEMAMSGVPVVVAGKTHYRGKGFTLDPANWEAYFEQLDLAAKRTQSYRLAREQVEQAWNYAYRFFFEYPLPFPWHLTNYWDALEEWPLSRLLTEQGWGEYGQTFRYLCGEPRDWSCGEESGETPPTRENLERE